MIDTSISSGLSEGSPSNIESDFFYRYRDAERLRLLLDFTYRHARHLGAAWQELGKSLKQNRRL